VLGEVGDRGNATGCHLHFEVHLHNGSIYGPDNVDPSVWLRPTDHGRGATKGKFKRERFRSNPGRRVAIGAAVCQPPATARGVVGGLESRNLCPPRRTRGRTHDCGVTGKLAGGLSMSDWAVGLACVEERA
jgi:hypothetical protein